VYLKGRGVTRDYSAAIDWFTKSADQGYAAAQYQLGMMYAKGRGVTQDYSIAASWFEKAANQGYVVAQYELGVMYLDGLGVARNHVKSHMWLSLALVNVGQEAREMLIDIVERPMTPDQIDAAKRSADLFRKNLRLVRLK